VTLVHPQVELRIPAKLLPIFEPRRFKVMHGGRGGGKSHTVAQALIVMAMQSKHRILCVREVQKSLEESSKRVIEDYIERLGLGAYFDITKKHDEAITCRVTGSTFSFSGLKDHTADSIKSFEGATLVWVEEAHSVSAHSWNILTPTILRTDGAEILATFNPDQEDDYVYQRFVANQDPNAWVVEINWWDNPWFNEAMDEERRQLQAINDDLYQHVWGGKCRSAAGLLFKRPWFKFYDILPAKLNKYISSDYAGGLDPDNPNSDPDDTCHGVWGVTTDGDLYLVDGWAGQDDTAEAIGQWLGLVGKHKPMRSFDEKGPILRAIDPFIRRAMRTKRIFVCRESLASAGSKSDRALGFAALASAGCVYLPNTAFGQKVLNQLCAFNGQDGRPDDCVDMCSLMARGLDFMANAGKMAEDKRKMPDDYGINDDETDSWKVA
jgi:phage terminase large subunit-like protein